MPSPFRWMPHDGKRHAISTEALPGAETETLCGVELVRPMASPPKYPDWLWPECQLCNDRWRQAEGIPLRSNGSTAGAR